MNQLTAEYINSIYTIDYKNMEAASTASYKMRELGIALTSEQENQLASYRNTYENKMKEIGKMATDQFTPALNEILKEYINSPFCFPIIRDNKIAIKIGKGWVSISLLMNITTKELSYDTFKVSVNKTELEPFKDKIEAELSKIMNN